jgi:hypothetical protein
MELFRKIDLRVIFSFIFIALFSISSNDANADHRPVSSIGVQLSPGYTEQYSFKVDGQVIGTQTAVLVRTDNGQQTWTFNLTLTSRVAGETHTFQQSGSFVVDNAAHAISYDTIAVSDGISQSEKVVVGNRGATADFDPEIPGINHVAPILGDPYLLVNNLVTPLSLATRALHSSKTPLFLVPAFSVDALRQVVITFRPKQSSNPDAKWCEVYDGTLYVPGSPDSTFEYWLSRRTGQIVRCFNRELKLDITRN